MSELGVHFGKYEGKPEDIIAISVTGKHGEEIVSFMAFKTMSEFLTIVEDLKTRKATSSLFLRGLPA